jgi:hypothetical protein
MPEHDNLADYRAIEQPFMDMRIGQADTEHVAQLPCLIFPLNFFQLVIFRSVHLSRLASFDCGFDSASSGFV